MRVIMHFSFMSWMHMAVGTMVSVVLMVVHVLIFLMGVFVGMLMFVFMGMSV